MKRILVIDDEPDIREITKISLQITKHWEVLTAVSGLEGVEIAASQAIDAILLDVIMPNFDGLATLKALKTHSAAQNIPVLLLTATAKLALQTEYLAWGAQGILLKPFDPGTLGEQIETMLGWPSSKIEQSKQIDTNFVG
ncbi:MAG: response regulator [Leptolyngbyaceae cyanobacterium]